MLLRPKGKKGSLCLELLIYLPVIAGIFFSLIHLQLFFLESLSLDQATYETVKSLVSLEIAESTFESVFNEQAGFALSALGAIGLRGSLGSKLILAHDDTGYLVEANMEEARIVKEDGLLCVYCRYRSAFLPSIFIESRAVERSWKP